MWYKVTRTSDKFDNGLRCEEAECKTYTRENKTEGVYRAVNIDTLEQLIAFAEKYGAIVIQANDSFSEGPVMASIEIYDDYRE